MTRMVQVAVAGDVSEAEEMQAILRAAGIESELQAGEDDPLTVWVPETELVSAQEALEALTEPDELLGEP
jgi:type III secretory pathway lipoprotein EscJ